VLSCHSWGNLPLIETQSITRQPKSIPNSNRIESKRVEFKLDRCTSAEPLLHYQLVCSPLCIYTAFTFPFTFPWSDVESRPKTEQKTKNTWLRAKIKVKASTLAARLEILLHVSLFSVVIVSVMAIAVVIVMAGPRIMPISCHVRCSTDFSLLIQFLICCFAFFSAPYYGHIIIIKSNRLTN